MDGKLQTSFIPKQPLVENKPKKSPASTNVFSIIGWFIFIVAVLASLGVFAYEQMLIKSIDSKNAELTNRIKKFDIASVDRFIQLNSRLQAANTLMENHSAVSALLGLISTSTIQSVQFTGLEYSYDEANNSNLILTGKAPNFASVALQSDSFGSKPYFKNQVFSELGLDTDGGVLFQFNASIEPSYIKYKINN